MPAINPLYQTNSTERVPLAYPLRLRQGNQNTYAFAPYQVQDEGMVNAIPVKDSDGQGIIGVTRPGINGIFINNSSENGQVRGMYVWEKTAGTVYTFVVCGTKVYSAVNIDTTSSFTGVNFTQVNTLLTSATTPVRFTEYIDDVNTKKLIMVDGVEGYIFTDNTAGTKITDADFPSPHVPFPVFLDGYLFLAKAGTGDIYNSDLNDPTSWTPGNFFSAEMYPDDLQALAKVNNYILGIGTQSCEYFYDAGNDNGSPLARYDGATLPFGCQFPNSIACNEDQLVFLANFADGQSTFTQIKGFQYIPIESHGIVPIYSRMIRNPNVGYEINYASCRGCFFKYDGELYYSFLFDGVRGGAYQVSVFDACYIYSFGVKAWTEFQYGNDSTSRANRYAMPIQFSCHNTTGNLTTYVAGNIGTTATAFFAKLDDSIAYDVMQSFTNQQIYQEFRTPNLDFGSLNRKSMSRLGINVECGDSTLQPLLSICWNDQDFNYNTWTSYISPPNQNDASSADFFPFITQLGSFRRRAFRLISTNGKTMTARFLEVDINKGQV